MAGSKSSVAVLAVAVAVAGFAAGNPPVSAGALTDADAAGNNAVSGQRLDVKLDETGPATRDSTTDETDADEVRDTWEDLSHPDDGTATVSNTLEVATAGSTTGVGTLNLTVTYAENDSGGTAGNAGETAETLEVTTFTYNGTDLLGTELTDRNGNGIVDVDDLTRDANDANLSALDGPAAGANATVEMELSGDAGLLDIVALGDGVDVEVGVRAEDGFVDADRSADNTLIYG